MSTQAYRRFMFDHNSTLLLTSPRLYPLWASNTSLFVQLWWEVFTISLSVFLHVLDFFSNLKPILNLEVNIKSTKVEKRFTALGLRETLMKCFVGILIGWTKTTGPQIMSGEHESVNRSAPIIFIQWDFDMKIQIYIFSHCHFIQCTKFNIFSHSTEIFPCAANPCQNDGLCFNGATGGYICICPDGFEGTDCEIGMSFQPCRSV